MGMALLLGGLRLWREHTEPLAHWSPEYSREELQTIAEKKVLSEEEYRFLFYQTGLSRRAVERIPLSERMQVLREAQEAFFLNPAVSCERSTLISWEERNQDRNLPGLWGLQDGDILITFCSHAFGWRNGHAALVVDAQNGRTLEAVVMGQDSCLQETEKWRSYPSFLVLRLRGCSREQGSKIATLAMRTGRGIPYGFLQDFLEHLDGSAVAGKLPDGKSADDMGLRDTDCSHLIWRIYQNFGVDLDSNGGFFVTPADIAKSPCLEIVQMYGVDVDKVYEPEEEKENPEMTYGKPEKEAGKIGKREKINEK